MRGVPGSGKSTVARQLAGKNGIIHSTDDFFMVDGEYRFNPDKLREHHDANHKAFCESVAAGAKVVICDNTNTQPWQYERYVKSAEEADYMVVFVVMPHPTAKIAAGRNTHGVPEHIIERMIRDWKN